jgi:ketosteroid isomerase-like protein
MSAETDRIDQFYSAFKQRDGAAMAACYHADASFRDPVFELRGDRIGAMWTMLCERGKDLRIEHSNVTGGDGVGAADWQAWYTFSATGRPVHNVIHAQFRFRDGRFVEHIDRFDFWRWSRQAVGPAGLLLGWTPMVRRKVRAEANRALERYIAGR